MKRVVLMIVSALICGIWFASSCNKKDNSELALNIKAVAKSSPSVRSTFSEETVQNEILLWCKGKKIEWYNATTGELKLEKLENETVHPHQLVTDNYFDVFYMYLGDDILFKLRPISVVMSIALNYPVLVEDVNEDFNDAPKYYIGRGYPNWEYWTDKFWTDTNWDKAENAHWVEERELNWKAIEPEWNKFIEHLKEEGKYRE